MPEQLLERLAQLLLEDGLPLVRLASWSPTRHPEVWGTQAIWTRGQGPHVIARPRDTFGGPAYVGTPGQAMLEGPHFIHCALDVPTAELAYPVLAEIAALGASDYVMVPVEVEGPDVAWLAVAIERSNGFFESELAGIKDLAHRLSLHFQLAIAQHVTKSLLEVYLGANASRRVLAGDFQRGTGSTVSAAIWFCDMRQFTALGDNALPRDLVQVLDAYFEAIAEPIEREGGEILKFIGDAALAIFPLDPNAPNLAARRALTAGRGALAAVAALKPQVRIGIGLHVGEVIYGNIGGKRRLDFTVIGRAVNEVCRVEALTKELGVPLLMTEAFVRVLGESGFESFGAHALKGVATPATIFGVRS
jgi:adenylate cyclase